MNDFSELENELKKLLHSAGLKPEDALRTNEPAYREHVAGRNLSDEQLLGVMAEHPELIQRPIVVRGNKAVLARPVENLAKLGIKCVEPAGLPLDWPARHRAGAHLPQPPRNAGIRGLRPIPLKFADCGAPWDWGDLFSSRRGFL